MASHARQDLRDPVFQGYSLLRLGFTVAPILFGADKFLNVMVDWTRYVAPWIDDMVPGTAQQLMYAVGGIEIIAGLAVAVAPWFGGYVVAAWLGGIIVNLITAHPTKYYDVALRDLGLLLGALTLARLASVYRRPTVASSDRSELKAAA